MPRTSVLIYNPAAGGQVGDRLVARLARRLERSGFIVEPRRTAGPGDATRLAREAVAEGVDVAFALGGDGTLRETAAGLLDTDVALGALPAGTANVLCYELGLPRRPTAAALAFATAEVREIDVGLAGGWPFLMMVSCGLDAMVMAHADGFLKRRLGVVGVGLTGLRRWWSYDYPEIRVRFDGRTERVGFFSLSNIPYFGGPFRMAPDADSLDGRLDLVLFRGRSRWRTLHFAIDVGWGRHGRRDDVEIHRVREVELLGPCAYGLQIDGDVLPADLPMPLRLSTSRLKVLAPSSPRSRRRSHRARG
ncbi:MAG: diacylglycerol kinase family protein [Acidobacteriota bacterium]